MIKIFNLVNKKIVPSEHCYTLSVLKDIMEAYPEDHITIYEYLFYMTCPDANANPFFNARLEEKETMILKQINLGVSLEDELIVEGLKFCKALYETPTLRAYDGIKNMLDKLADYMRATPLSGGRDGNITAVVNAAAKFEAIRTSFKGAFQDLEDEQGLIEGRGKQKMAYDQKQ